MRDASSDKTVKRRTSIKPGWKVALLTEVVAAFALSAVLVALPVVAGADAAVQVYTFSMWILLPAVGFFLARMATAWSLDRYVSWIIPPLCEVAAHWFIYGYPPESILMPVVSALISLLGAAYQFESDRRNKKNVR